MNISHLFRRGFEALPPNNYQPEVTPGCEWVLEGHAIACRLYGEGDEPAPFFAFEDNEPREPFDVEPETPTAYAWYQAYKEQRGTLDDGLYQLLIQGKKTCPRCKGCGEIPETAEGTGNFCERCGHSGLIDPGPRLVRVGDVNLTEVLQTCGDKRLTYDRIREDLCFSIRNHMFGIIWFHEDDEHKPWEQRRVCKVERRLFR